MKSVGSVWVVLLPVPPCAEFILSRLKAGPVRNCSHNISALALKYENTELTQGYVLELIYDQILVIVRK